jgi:predicted RNA-binding protein with PIN domain
VLIDGYNVIRRTQGLAAAERLHGPVAGRDALIQKVAGTYRQTAHTVVVVFDGDGRSETFEPLPRCRGRVIFTRAGESADAVIQRIAAQERRAGRCVRVYTDDVEVQSSVEAHGGRAGSAKELTRAAHAPDRFRAKQAQHQAFVRRQLAQAEDEGAGDGVSRRSRQSGKRGRRTR